MSGAEQGATGCSEAEQGKQSMGEGAQRGALPYRSSFLAAAAEAGLISARRRDCTAGEQQCAPQKGSSPEMVDTAAMQMSEDRTGCVEAEQSSRAGAGPLLGSRSSSQTLHRKSTTPEPM